MGLSFALVLLAKRIGRQKIASHRFRRVKLLIYSAEQISRTIRHLLEWKCLWQNHWILSFERVCFLLVFVKGVLNNIGYWESILYQCGKNYAPDQGGGTLT